MLRWQTREGHLSWCDKLASTSGLVLELNVHHASGNSILDAMSPIFDRHRSRDGTGFELQKLEDFNVQFVTNEGYQYTVTPRTISIEYVYRIQVQYQSAGPPKAWVLSEIIPYSAQLLEISKRLMEVGSLFPDPKTRSIERITVISQTNVDPDDLPPGIQRLLRYMGRPWSHELESYQTRVVASLGGDKVGNSIRCTHSIGKQQRPETKEPQVSDGLVNVRFDWQRKFKTGRRIEPKSMREIVSESIKDANQYFEELAEGNRFDENILTGTV
ncbi:MAG: hypothetical protein J0H44_15690 [Alphaproteobacteria bacterium]|nr:hypothetical protein [Alphaproteobacteria bacterium]